MRVCCHEHLHVSVSGFVIYPHVHVGGKKKVGGRRGEGGRVGGGSTETWSRSLRFRV
jgi:hypothetical protein